MKRIIQLFTLFTLLATLTACNLDEAMAEEVVRLQTELMEAKEKITELEGNTTTKDASGMIHTVFFWLKEGLTEEQIANFKVGVKSLKAIETVERFYVGGHANTQARDVVDHSYDYSLIVHFKDEAAQEVYQVHPIHLKFVENFGPFFEKVIVYDSLVE